MQVAIFLIELHDDLLHTGWFAFILHNVSYFIQSDRRILCVGHKVNWSCSKVRCLSDRCCNCFFSAPHNCKRNISKKHVVATIGHILLLFRKQLIGHLAVGLGHTTVHAESQSTQNAQRSALLGSHARSFLCLRSLPAAISQGSFLPACDPSMALTIRFKALGPVPSRLLKFSISPMILGVT